MIARCEILDYALTLDRIACLFLFNFVGSNAVVFLGAWSGSG
jgi:hypothetical protein